MQGLLEAVRWLLFFVIVEQVGEEALAWSNLVYACFLILLIPTYAVAEGTNALVSNLIGQGRSSEVLRLTARATRITYLVTAPLAALAILVPHHVIRVFTDDPAAIAGAAPSLRVVAVAMVLVVPAEMWLSAVAGTGATDVAMAIEAVLTVVLLAGTVVAALALGLPLAYVWASAGFAALVTLGLCHWQLTTKRARSLD
jgi:Na+-driven multidrug efflux pump